MNIDKEKIKDAITSLNKSQSESFLPDWDELPYIELYMDQVISILERYLEFYRTALEKEKTVTASMINNYVKLGTIPPPVKKKYSRIHMAYLIIVFTLKQTLDMATIQKIIPVGISEDSVKQIYNSFVANRRKTFEYVTENIKALTVSNSEKSSLSADDIIMQTALSANICKILTEKITSMQQKTES